MMSRTQITLPPADHQRARRRAAELGISLAEYVRRLVRRDLDEIEPKRPLVDVAAIIGLGDSGGSNVARQKDTYVGEAIQAHRRRTRRR
jgi:predicted DNA-binding protein